jgi:hypothetical protein
MGLFFSPPFQSSRDAAVKNTFCPRQSRNETRFSFPHFLAFPFLLWFLLLFTMQRKTKREREREERESEGERGRKRRVREREEG